MRPELSHYIAQRVLTLYRAYALQLLAPWKPTTWPPVARALHITEVLRLRHAIQREHDEEDTCGENHPDHQ